MIALGAGVVASNIAASAEAQPEDMRHRLNGVVEQILDAYDSADLVCLGERHGNVADSQLRIQLVRHPDFAKKVDVIVVEFANPVHQTIIDRYTSGDDVPLNELRRVWRDTVGSYRAWESPVYEDLFRTVREVNAALAPEDRLRIVAGDVPIDWSRVSSLDKYLEELAPNMVGPYVDRGSYPVKVIEREVFSKGFTALAIYGSGHIERWSTGFTPELEAKSPSRIHLPRATFSTPSIGHCFCRIQ